MYKRMRVKKLGRTASHRKALIQNQLRSIFVSGKIETSSVKAKVLKGELESLLSRIYNSKDEDVTLVRDLLTILGNKEQVKKALELGKKEDIKVSIKKVGFRNGDNCELSLVEIVGFTTKKKRAPKEKRVEKTEDKEEIKGKEEIPMEYDSKKSMLNIGKKDIKEGVKPVKRERAKSRAGI